METAAAGASLPVAVPLDGAIFEQLQHLWAQTCLELSQAKHENRSLRQQLRHSQARGQEAEEELNEVLEFFEETCEQLRETRALLEQAKEENERLKASGALPSPKSSPTLVTTIPQSVRHCPPTLRALIQRALAKNQLTQQKMLFIDKELQYIMNGQYNPPKLNYKEIAKAPVKFHKSTPDAVKQAPPTLRHLINDTLVNGTVSAQQATQVGKELQEMYTKGQKKRLAVKDGPKERPSAATQNAALEKLQQDAVAKIIQHNANGSPPSSRRSSISSPKDAQASSYLSVVKKPAKMEPSITKPIPMRSIDDQFAVATDRQDRMPVVRQPPNAKALSTKGKISDSRNSSRSSLQRSDSDIFGELDPTLMMKKEKQQAKAASRAPMRPLESNGRENRQSMELVFEQVKGNEATYANILLNDVPTTRTVGKIDAIEGNGGTGDFPPNSSFPLKLPERRFSAMAPDTLVTGNGYGTSASSSGKDTPENAFGEFYSAESASASNSSGRSPIPDTFRM